MLEMIVHIVIVLLFPPLLLGVINKTKAFFAGRKGAPFFQPYFDIAKLLRKGVAVSSTTSWVFWSGPVVGLAVVLAGSTILPLGGLSPVFSFSGDFVVLAYLLALSRFLTGSSALDTGSAFEGMGTARELGFAVLTEPALFFVFLVLARLSGSFSLGLMLDGSRGSQLLSAASAPEVMLVMALFIILLAENSRLPVDDPNTHLELTMIHEVMVLDHSGPLLGLIEYAASLKFFVFSSLVIGLLVPSGVLAAPVATLAFLAGLLLVAVEIGRAHV